MSSAARTDPVALRVASAPAETITPERAAGFVTSGMWLFIVTEYGMVNLKGKSIAERARALIGIAHPDFRESLERQAYEHGLIPRGVSL